MRGLESLGQYWRRERFGLRLLQNVPAQPGGHRQWWGLVHVLRAIEDQTGLNQFAIQREFGGKEGLLVEAMKVYADSARRHALKPPDRAGETCKLNGIDPQAYLADILARIANDHPINRVDELLPWVWAQNR